MLHYDDTDRPLIRVALAGVVDPADGVAFAARMDRLLAADERFVLVLDDRLVVALSSGRPWRRVRMWGLRRRRELAQACAAVAVTAAEHALPQVDRATRRLARMIPAPLSIFVEPDMAEQWVHSRVASGRRRPVSTRSGSEWGADRPSWGGERSHRTLRSPGPLVTVRWRRRAVSRSR